MGRSNATVVGLAFLVTWVVATLLTVAWVAMGTGWGDESGLLVGKAVVAALAGLVGAFAGGRLARRRPAGSRARLAAGAGAGIYLLLEAFAGVVAGSFLMAAAVLVAGGAGAAVGALFGSRGAPAETATYAPGR